MIFFKRKFDIIIFPILLPRDVLCIARTMLSQDVRPSVCPSVWHSYQFITTNKWFRMNFEFAELSSLKILQNKEHKTKNTITNQDATLLPEGFFAF